VFAVVDAVVRIPDSAGQGASQTNRRTSNKELRMSKSASGDPRLSFAVLRFGVLRFCCSDKRRRRRRRSLSDRLKKSLLKNGVDARFRLQALPAP
jgi:hypothetical protein